MGKFTLPQKVQNIESYSPGDTCYEIRLDANESFISIPANIRRKIAKRLKKIDYNRYPDPSARILCEKFAARYDLTPDLVVAGNGSDELISVIINSFFEKGDKIICFSPDFSMYRFYAKLAELEVISLAAGNEMLQKAKEKGKDENAKAVIFSNPCNPTGCAIPKEEILDFIRETDMLVILDEAYMDFFSQSILSEIENFDNLIILRTLSKAVGAAALRLGFAVAAKELSSAIRKCKSPYNVNSVSQEIGEIILSENSFLDKSKAEILASREQLFSGLAELSKKCGGFEFSASFGNFAFIYSVKADYINLCLLKQSIKIRSFGNGYLRITCGSFYENTKLLAVLSDILEEKDERD